MVTHAPVYYFSKKIILSHYVRYDVKFNQDDKKALVFFRKQNTGVFVSRLKKIELRKLGSTKN